MNGIPIGTLTSDGHRLAAVAALLLFVIVAGIVARLQRRDHRGGTIRWVALAVVAWIIGARLGFVVANRHGFAGQPLDIVGLWHGGFLPGAGWAAGIAVFLLAMLRNAAAALKPLAFGAAVALVAQRGITAMLPLPEVMLPEEQLAALGGDGVHLAAHDRPVVLNLWATWCPPCRREMPMMTELAAQMPEVAFVFANQGESNSRILGYLVRENLPLEGMVRDPQSRLMAVLGAMGLPTTMVFDTEGRLVAAQMGEVSREALVGMIGEATGEPAGEPE